MTQQRILSIRIAINYPAHIQHGVEVGATTALVGMSLHPVHPYFDLRPELLLVPLADVVPDNIDLSYGWFADPVNIYLKSEAEAKQRMNKALLEELERVDAEYPDSPAVV